MGLFSGITHAISNFFGGGDDEEKKRREQQAQQQAARNQASQNRPQLNVLGQQQRSQNIQDLLDPKKALAASPGIGLIQSGNGNTAAPVDPAVAKKAELDALTEKNMQHAKQQREQGESWWNRNVPVLSNKGDIQRDATTLARSAATRDYQEKHGYVKDPTVLDYGAETKKLGDQHSADLKASASRLDTFAKGATKAAQIAQYVPVTGTVLNLGLAGAERENVGGMKDEIANQRYQNEFGMTKEQFDALDPKIQAKLHNVRNVGYALSPLDFTGLAGIGKSEATNVAKDAAIQFVKEGAVDEAKQAALKTAGKQLVKRELINTGVAAAGQQYLSGKVDPLEALKTGTLLTGTGELFNPVNLEKSAKAPGMKSVNKNLVEDAKAQIANEAAQNAANVAHTNVDPVTGKTDLSTPAYQRGTPTTVHEAAAQNDLGVNNVPDNGFNDADARIKAGEAPNPTNDALDIPSFIRKDPTAAKNDAIARMQKADAFLEQAKPENAQVRKFKEQQEIADAYRQSPEHGKAVERLIAARPENNGEGAAIALGDKHQAVADYNMARQAEAANNVLRGGDQAVNPQAVENAVPPVTEAAVAVNPQEAAPAAAAVPTPSAVAEAAPTPGEVVQPASAAPAPGGLPSIPENAPGTQQVPVAPRTREAALAHLGELAKEIPGDGKMRDVTNLDDLAQSAKGAVEQITPEELVSTFGSDQIKGIQTDAKGFAILRAGRDKLSEMLKADPGNGDIKEALATTLDEMANRASGNGLLMRVVQEEFDNMPIEAKVRYLIKKIDGANQNVEGYESLRRDPAKLQMVENELNYRLAQSQTQADKLASLTALAQHAADAARQGDKVDLKGIAKEVTAGNTELQRLNGELVKYFETQVPKRSLGNRALVDTPKRLMLASVTGRLNDVMTTGFNVLEQQTTGITQGIIAKGVNAVSRLAGHPGLVTDSHTGVTKLPGGAWQGLKRTVGEIRGNQYTENLERSLKGNEDLRTGLSKSRGKLSRTIQASTELATNLTEGTKTQRLVQLAEQEAKKLGLKGEMKKQYTEARTIAPSRNMIEAADKLKMEMNNLNENPVSRKLTQVSASIGGNSVVGGIIKNQILPFTSWLGGNIYNSVTDKNAVASFIKFGNALRKGDPEAAVKNAARTINGVTQAYVLGYQLTKQGILTDKNAEGYGDDGPFVKIGNRYIPAKFFGFFAPNIVLGNAAYAATEGNTDGSSPAKVIADKIANYGWHSLAFGQALGADNTIARATDAMNRPGGSKGDAAATAAGGVVGQFIPGVSGDVSSLLDNGVNIGGKQIISDQLNPTHEAPETRVGKTGLTPTGRESKAKDIPASTIAGLQSRIPGLSQSLPRKEGVAAKDVLDRTTRGDRDTATSVNNRATAKAEVDQAADFKKRGIPNYKEPNFDDKIQARFDNGDYDSAIEGLTTKYNSVKDNKDVPLSQKKDLEDKIALNTVHKEGKFAREMVDTYKKYSVSEWRAFGDPEDDNYNPTLYQKLYDYDSALAKAGISGNENDKTQNKYTQKKSKSGSGSGRGGKSPAIGNTLGEIGQLSKISFGDLKLEKTPSGGKIPTVTTVKPGELIKKRQISVRSGR